MLKDLMIDGQKVGQVNVPDGRRIEHRKPKLGEEFIDATEPESGVKTASFSFSTNHHFVLVPLPPQLVPLGPEDQIVGTSVLQTSYGQSLVVAASPVGVTYMPLCVDESQPMRQSYTVTYKRMFEDKSIAWSKHADGNFATCSKPAP